MEPRKPSLDLERELTCSICTELLYQPLTLLDCLHTFCGACLKEWFDFQAATADGGSSFVFAGQATTTFTCPACRSAVRDSRHNATVATLLDMFVTANPSKARSAKDKEDMARKYLPGDRILPKGPKLDVHEVKSEQARDDHHEARILGQVQGMTLQEVPAAMVQPLVPGRRRHSRSRDGTSRPSSNNSPDGRSRRSHASRRQGADQGRQRIHNGSTDEADRQQRAQHQTGHQHQVEHQSSIRSLIGSAHTAEQDAVERDFDREVEEFARQIQEDGLLDGLDLDNIDLSRDDELSRRITEAYRRRQRDRLRRPGPGSNSPARPPAESEARARAQGSESRRAPLATTGAESRDSPRHRDRSRTSSATTAAAAPCDAAVDARPTARSQTELATRPQAEQAPRNPVVPVQRSQPEAVQRTQSDAMSRASSLGPLTPRTDSSEHTASNSPSVVQSCGDTDDSRWSLATRTPLPSPPSSVRAHRPSDLVIVHSMASSPKTSPSSAGHQRTRSQLYAEPSITCSRCNKAHIEYELHFNCAACSAGQWNICLYCYRAGKGCLYWFGFGYGAWDKWTKARQHDENLALPHMLTASRYMPPPSTPGGADGRKTLTIDDPRTRLETGTFCAKCLAWTNQCYWRCDICNEGDWGYCNDCVNQGWSCSHLLLPLAHEALILSPSQQRTPRSPGRPQSASLFTGPQASNIGPFKPLMFRTRCHVCQEQLSPHTVRYHCFSCTSAMVPDASPGDYDVCTPCYGNLVAHGRISPDNGHLGWRRCLKGHRMALVGFVDGKVGQWRFVERDLVGGRGLHAEPLETTGPPGQAGLQVWSWRQGEERRDRFVTLDVSAMAPASTCVFPPDGGSGMRAQARWAWFPHPDAHDELLFPKGAEIREIEDVNGEWFFGTYMGERGLFPAPYVRILEADETA
ncbi:hypothetical protein CDD82_3250 [Ophiocordyceps australis]|uniref:RING-type domain-containing protein n=1 Tax=Ophiocordyceps australis TaxID=1399860 RepID=A0A2C5XQR6_9HYPO|nr:hypothetical protein CDD82_3250 [Ophiocordyceps australis]